MHLDQSPHQPSKTMQKITALTSSGPLPFTSIAMYTPAV